MSGLGDSAAIILAAGKSTRMGSDLPKALHEVCGRAVLGYMLSACRLAGVDRLIVVIGHGRDRVKAHFAADRDVEWVEQREQNGTGHAVACCRKALAGLSGSVIVVAGDMPLLQRQTVVDLLEQRELSGDALTFATTVLDDPTGYGRIIRDNGKLRTIVEHRACTDEQLAINEVNPSYYCFDADRMFAAIADVTPSSPEGEVYLTDTVGVLQTQGHAVSADIRVGCEDAMGINTRLDLARVARAMEDRIQLKLMAEGVTIVDPDNTWIEADVTIGRDTMIYPFSFIGLGATIGEECRIGPFGHVPAGAQVHQGTKVASENKTKVGAL